MPSVRSGVCVRLLDVSSSPFAASATSHMQSQVEVCLPWDVVVGTSLAERLNNSHLTGGNCFGENVLRHLFASSRGHIGL